jgi:hypothetical protein
MARRRVLPLLMNNGKPWNEASHPPPPPLGRVKVSTRPDSIPQHPADFEFAPAPTPRYTSGSPDHRPLPPTECPQN